MEQQHSSHVEEDKEIGSTYEGITALPKWEGVRSPPLTHFRHGSTDPVLGKDVLSKAGLGTTGPIDRSGASTPRGDENPRHSRMIIWLVSVVVIILAVAVTLGALLGTFVNPKGSSDPSPSVTEIPAGPMTPTATATTSSPTQTSTPFPHFASLSVTGWGVGGPQGYYTTWLFSQDGKGYLSRATYNSSTGNWTRVSNFAKAKLGTPLTASSLNTAFYRDQSYQTSVVYLDDSNYLNEWIFPDNGPITGQRGPLTQQKYVAHDESKIASYWPKLVYQGLSGEIRCVHFECDIKNECWHDYVLRTTQAINGSQLTMVPMKDNLATMGLFYQQEDGTYVNYQENSNLTSELWTARAFPTRIPTNASFAAFATRQLNEVDESNLSTHILWQDVSGIIQMSWTNSNGSWSGPSAYSAFAGAENGTAITCLTGVTFPGFPLPPGTELSRCYFQTGNAVREVSFNGDSWDIVNVVPIQT